MEPARTCLWASTTLAVVVSVVLPLAVVEGGGWEEKWDEGDGRGDETCPIKPLLLLPGMESV